MASYPSEPSLFPQHHIEQDEDEDDEVDQLDSDSDVEEGGESTGFCSGQRIPGQTLLPAVRIENILHADGITGSLSMSKEAQFLLSIATEEFIKRMAQAGERQAGRERRPQISFHDMASSTQQYQEFMFLQDTVPQPIPLADALRRREEKEREMLDIIPAISAVSPSYAPSTLVASAASQSSKSKGKSRANGKEKQTNGSSSRKESKKERPKPNGLDGQTRSASRGSRRSRDEWVNAEPDDYPAMPLTHAYTQPHYPVYSDPNGEYDVEPDNRRGSQDGIWAAPYTGPSSAFLQDPLSSFTRLPTNPGRTIYSHRMEGSLR